MWLGLVLSSLQALGWPQNVSEAQKDPNNRGDVFLSDNSSLSPLFRWFNAELVLDIIVIVDGGHMSNHSVIARLRYHVSFCIKYRTFTRCRTQDLEVKHNSFGVVEDQQLLGTTPLVCPEY